MHLFIDYVGELNWFAILVASLASFVVGAIWYSKPVFGKQWQKEVGLTDKKMKQANMVEVISVSAMTVIISAIAVSLLVKAMVLETAYQGALFGVMLAFGILGANKLMQVKFEQRIEKYWFITLGADILSFAIMGAILAVWH